MNDLLESQVRELLRQADGLDFDSVPAASDVIAAGGRVVRRRRLVRVTSAAAVTALLAVGAYAVGGRPSAAPTTISPAATTSLAAGPFITGSTGSLSLELAAGSAGEPAVGPLTIDWNVGTQDGVDALQLSGSTFEHPTVFTQEQIETGAAYVWLDNHTLLAVTRPARPTLVLTDLFENQASVSGNVARAQAELTVTVFQSPMRDRARVGVVWLGADGLAHGTPGLSVASLAVDDGHGLSEVAWACPQLNASGTISDQGASRDVWTSGDDVPAMRFDNVPDPGRLDGTHLPAGSWSTLVVEITGSDEVTFAPDTTKPGATVTPSQIVAKDGAWWAVFTVPGPSVGATSWISWRSADGTHHEGPVL